MRSFTSLILIFLGVGGFIFFGYNIFTLMWLILLCFVAGVIGGPYVSRRQIDSDNLSSIAQIERNRYFRKPE